MKPRAFAPVLTFLSLAVSPPAAAESEPWLVRDTLTDGWFGLAEPLSERGIEFDLSTTAYYAGLLSGTGDQDFEWGGRADAFLKVDTGKLGLWDGGGFHAHLESRFGDSADRTAPRSGGIWPPNTGVVLPLGHPEEVFASSIYYSHRFPTKTSLLIGKINAVDLLAGAPFFGGWARDRFTNIAFVAPPSGVVPPTIMGAVLSQKLHDFTLTFMAFDPEDRTGDYWKDVGGSVMLPGTNRASDRFARMSYYVNASKQSAEPREAVATVFSIMRNVSVPIGISTPGKPNVADTLWLTVGDQKNKAYYFQDTTSPSILWAKLGDIDFKEGSGVRKLQLDGNPDIAGNQTANFKPAEPFKYLVP